MLPFGAGAKPRTKNASEVLMRERERESAREKEECTRKTRVDRQRRGRRVDVKNQAYVRYPRKATSILYSKLSDILFVSDIAIRISRLIFHEIIIQGIEGIEGIQGKAQASLNDFKQFF